MSASDEAQEKAVPMRLLLVDDQVMFLDVLKRQFSRDPLFEVVGVARTSDGALSKGIALKPDVMVMDISLGDKDTSFRILEQLKEAVPTVRVVMLSMFDYEMYRDQAFEMGADVYTTKGISFVSLRAILLGQPIPKRRAVSSQVWFRTEDWKPKVQSLSARELQVVDLLVAGKTEGDIARELSISVSSVGTYLKRIRIKTGCSERGELLRMVSSLNVHLNKQKEEK